MASIKFDTPEELLEYVISIAPTLDPEFIELLRGMELADALTWLLNHLWYTYPNDRFEDMCEVIRDNIRLASGDDSSFDLADMVGAAWDCYA